MAAEDPFKKLWSGDEPPARGGPYEYKGVRFNLSAAPGRQGWRFQAFGEQPMEFGSWEEAGPAIHETCMVISKKRAARREI
ncbi:MAG: hypothetical protein H0V09_03750 [Gemmatimonadetes bacterium]|nr:hypothetical protein [Gemmatimonadota bacterium]